MGDPPDNDSGKLPGTYLVYRFTDEPRLTWVPDGGSVVNTFLSGGPNTLATASPACCMVAVACCTPMPPTFGTVTTSGPFDTVTLTLPPFTTCWPAPGVVATTLPLSTVSLNWSSRTGFRPAAFRAATASS